MSVIRWVTQTWICMGNLSRKDCAFPLLPCSSITTVQSIFHSVRDQRHRNGNNQKENSMVRNATHCHVTTFYCMFFSGKWSCSHGARIEISYTVYEGLIVIIESKLTRNIIYHFFIGFSSRLLLSCVIHCCYHHFEYFGCWRQHFLTNFKAYDLIKMLPQSESLFYTFNWMMKHLPFGVCIQQL